MPLKTKGTEAKEDVPIDRTSFYQYEVAQELFDSEPGAFMLTTICVDEEAISSQQRSQQSAVTHLPSAAVAVMLPAAAG
jgi:hypothetical protein